MGAIVIVKPWPSRLHLAGMPAPEIVIEVVQVEHRHLEYTDFLGWLSYEEELGWPANTAQTCSRVSTSPFLPEVNLDFWVDEDGISKDLPMNPTIERFKYPGTIWGRAVVTGPMVNGWNYPLTDAQMRDVRRVLGF